MTPVLAQALPRIDWAWAGAALEGESGDLHVVVELDHGALLAVIDGLGHGAKAAVAAREAAVILRAHAALSLGELIVRCHEALIGTRGAVMSLAALDFRSSTMDWCGVGNVEGLLLRGGAKRTSEALTTRGGVIGYRLPPMKVSAVRLSPGDVLILASDGIKSGLSQAVDLDCEPRAIADAVLASCAKGSDDALVLVARYLGARP